MKSGNSLLPVLLFFVCLESAGQGIDSLRRNAISINVLPFIDRTIALSYARQLKNGWQVTVSPRVRIAEANPPSNVRNLIIGTSVVADPHWYYGQYHLRGGILFPIGGKVFFEPQIQLGYSFFKNKVLKTYDGPDEANDQSVRLDRKYYTGGVINNICWVKDHKSFRVKFFFGVGVHVRRYYETRYENIYYLHREVLSEPEKSTYWERAFTVHGGVELGLRF